MTSHKQTGALDRFRLIASFLIIAIHTSPLLSYSEVADFILTRIIARVGVPFFFMVTGYFLTSHVNYNDMNYIGALIKKLGVIYAISISLYIPLNIYTGFFSEPVSLLEIFKKIFIDGTFYHLWYLPSVVIGIIIITILVRKAGYNLALIFSAILYIIGLLGDSYYGLSVQIPFLKTFYYYIFIVFDYTRNGLFFAPIFIILGMFIYNSKKSILITKTISGLGVSGILLFIEGLLLYKYNFQRHDSMYIMLLPVMYFLFRILLSIDIKSSKNIRTISLLIYIIHPWIIVVLRGFSKITGLGHLFIDNSLVHFLSVSTISLASAWILFILWDKFHMAKSSNTNRAWTEIDLTALEHNVRMFQSRLPEQCKLMAVVKANAYGHGDIIIAKALNKLGINSFAVATLEEGIHLRKKGIRGEILILGYTNPCDAGCLARYRLTQTVIDSNYAIALNKSGKKIKVHLKIDTGMHRIGIDYSDISQIEAIYKLKNMMIEGFFSHLCVSDSLTDDNITYTDLQIERFFKVMNILKSKNYDIGKLHIQATYGVLNCSDLPCDYARLGIGLYGVLSNNERTRIEPNLQPVLTVKARVAQVKQILPGESVSYGRVFTAKENSKIAIVTIGYADGIPRNYSEANSYVLLKSQKAPIIGRICMDQLIIDVTHIDKVEPNEIVTIIGRDGNEVIRAEEVAVKCGTITNELLSRLSNRLIRVRH